jgi:hypothetical protein
MKRTGAVLAAALAAACGSGTGSTGSGTTNLDNFRGAAWNGTLNVTITCPGSAPLSGPSPGAIQLSSGTGADLQYASSAGCFFQFNVSGNTATLSNAPVSCSTSSGGVTFTSYTLTTNDGHTMTASLGGTFTPPGQPACSQTITGNLTR